MIFVINFLIHIIFLYYIGLVNGIIGGYNIKINDAPYHLSYGGVCGAVLIHKIWVLTTAHCGTNHSYVRIGSTWRLQGAIIRIQYHVIHPLYQLAHEFDYDVQLLKLWRSLKFSNMVRPIHIGRSFKESMYISGWGYTKEKGEYKDALQQVNIHVVPKDVCQKIDVFWYNQTLTERMFCAGDWAHDACQGDSGGGAVSDNGKLIGLSSFGFGCGRGLPGVYTNLSDTGIRNWIRKYTGV